MKKLTVTTLIITTMLTGACGSGSAGKGNEGNTLRFRTHSCIDQQGSGTEAFSLLLPVNWQFEGGIQWTMESPGMPAVIACVAYNPGSSEAFEILRDRLYCWTTEPSSQGMFPPGSRYLGSIVRSPLNAVDAIREILIPEERDYVKNLQITGEKNLPELPGMMGIQSGGSAETSGATIRFKYLDGDKPMEEEIFAVVEAVTYQMPSMWGTYYFTNWGLKYCFSFRAAEGQLDASAKLFQTMMSSFRLNPKWFAQYINFTDYLARQQIEQTNRIGELSRYISKMNDEVTDRIRQSYDTQNRMHDRVFQQWSDATLGVETYSDPAGGGDIRLPGGYNHAWINRNGEYIVSDNPNFNPNVGSNLSWEELRKKN